MLITGSAFNGVAATGQFATNVTLGELVSNKHRGPILSIIYLASIPFAVFSPVVARSWGSSTVQGWRWSYYLGIILNGIALVLYYLFYYPPFFKQLHVSRSRVRQLKDLDWVGICLFITGWGSFLVGIGWGGATHPWKSAQVLCPLILGIVFITAFVVYGKSSSKLICKLVSNIELYRNGILSRSSDHASQTVQEYSLRCPHRWQHSQRNGVLLDNRIMARHHPIPLY